jgi:hypothetical protein
MSILGEIVIWEYMAGFDFRRLPGGWWEFIRFIKIAEVIRSYSYTWLNFQYYLEIKSVVIIRMY